MKKILITGKNSYIGTSFENWLAKDPENYQVDTVGTRNNEWKEYDFSGYDVVFHVAGIAHNSSDSKLKDLYYSINRDLTIAVAKKAKYDGVKQFIFMSSIIVYGTKNEMIDKHTKPDPDNFYGDSKLQAELGLQPLETDDFRIVIIRPPMIYGEGSKGNYPKLARLAKMTPVFPNYDNQRSMLHIDNLLEFIRLVIENNESGTFHPQNKEYTNTSKMVTIISEIHKKNIYTTRLFNPIIKHMIGIQVINKVFGNLVYDMNLSSYRSDYIIRDLKESIEYTEK